MTRGVGLVLCILVASAASLPVQPGGSWQPAPNPLMTRWAGDVDPRQPWPEYPRPQLARPAWVNLNGLWDYAIRPAHLPQPTEFDGRILVPFPIESALSGVKRTVPAANKLWYHRTFTLEPSAGRRWLLHFGAVDWECTVYVNGTLVGTHRGGYDPFTFDITAAVKPEAGVQELIVAVTDPTDEQAQPRGKQVRNPHGIWYTPVTGIWQTVWLEPVGPTAIAGLKIFPDLNHSAAKLQIRTDGPTQGLTLVASHVRSRLVDRTEPVEKVTKVVAKLEPSLDVTLPLTGAKPWTPEEPWLHEVELEIRRGDQVVDRAWTYVGLRSIEMRKDEHGTPRLFLNGKPVFQYGPLDQGWWPDGLYTAPTDAALRFDIEATKRYGMNMCRKHVKVEPARWYHHCDRLGLLVWQDMPSGFKSSRRDHAIAAHAKDDAPFTDGEHAQFKSELKAMLDGLQPAPCIVVWVPFNEGWGQHRTNEVLRWVKEYDPTRLVGGPSGWTDRGYGDLWDMHNYPGPGMFPVRPDRVSVLGEFGGLGWPVKGSLWKEQRNWGYRTFDNKMDLQRGYERLVDQLPPLIASGLAAAVYTQTTDVEIEVNGLMTYDRKMFKIDPERVADRHRELSSWQSAALSVVLPTSEKEPQRWRYTETKPLPAWMEDDFDDTAWQQGPGGFGTKDTPGAVVGTTWSGKTLWLRRTFEFTPQDAAAAGTLFLRCHHDEDVEVYLNGKLVLKEPGYTVDYQLFPLTGAARDALKVGTNLLAVQVKQTAGGQFIDVGIVRLSLKR